MPGRLIIIDGIDGSGKTTQTKLLANALKIKGYKVFLTAEPYKGGLRDLIKSQFISKKSRINDGLIDALLFTADRRMHVLFGIDPMIKKDRIVVSDRYYHSTFAYQNTQGIDIKWLIDINSFARKPDLTIILDVKPEIGLRRVMKDRRNKIDKFEQMNFLRKLRKNYLKLPRLLRNENIIVIDANKSLEKVFESVKKVVRKELKLRI